jgi:hypothetical protein
LTAIPEGIKFIKKHGKDFLVVEKIFCPKGHNLIVNTVCIHGEPSLKLRVEVGKSEGLVFVDAFWGGHAKLYNFIPDIKSAGPMSKVFCPECGADMIVEDKCRYKGCDSKKAILFRLPGENNKIYVCAKLGCPGHRMDIVDLNKRVSEEVSNINYFGTKADDILMEI